MKNKKIFKGNKRETTSENKHNTNSSSSSILKHDINNIIVQLDESFLNI